MMDRNFAALSLLIILTMVAGCQKKSANHEVIPVVVTEAALSTGEEANRIYSGNIEPDVTVNASFTVGGYVRGILNVSGGKNGTRLVQEGDFVRKGTVLAHVRDVDYLAQVNVASDQVAGKMALTQQAEYGVQQSQAALDRASAGVSASISARDEARSGFDQAKSGLDASESQLSEAKAVEQAAQAQVEQAEAAKEKAQSDYHRAERLHSSKSLTQADYDAAKAQLKVGEAQVKAAKEEAKVAQTKIEQAKVQIQANRAKMRQTRTIIEQSEAAIRSAKAQERQASAALNGARAQVSASIAGMRAAKSQLTEAKTPLGDASLKSPIDGVVLKRNIEIGTLVGPGTPGFILGSLTSVKVVFGVPDTQMTQLHMGDIVSVSTQAFEDRQFLGKVTSISPAADPKSRVFKVEVTIPNPDKSLKAGMIAKVELPNKKNGGSLPVVPLSAVVRFPNSNEFGVYVAADENGGLVARARKVELGDTFGNTIAVKSGVKAGDRVISTGATLVGDGMPIRLVK
jgi:multidrug efflux system membrane fusion protein